MSPARAHARTPVIVLDRHGFAAYRDSRGLSIVRADRHAIRLVTDAARLAEAQGPELEAVIAVHRDDTEAYSEAARALYALGGESAGVVVAVAERLLLPAARLRDELGIPGMTFAETLIFRDKVLMKRHLRAHGIRVPDFAPLSEAAARGLFVAHSRLVVKPRLGAGTERVSVFHDIDDLLAAMTSLPTDPTAFEVEEFIDGPLFHIDSVVMDGQVIGATVGRYLESTMSYQVKRHVRSVAVPAGPLLDELLDFNRRVVACYRGFSGVTHNEVFLSDQGPYVCEIAARTGGGGIAAGFMSRTGVNLQHVAFTAQLEGRVPTSIKVAPHLTGWVLINAGPGTLRETIKVPGRPWVLDAQVFAEPGSVLSPPASCGDGVALISVSGTTEAEVIGRLDQVIEYTVPKLAMDA